MTGKPNSSQDPRDYDRPAVTVDTVVFTLRDEKLNVLLVRRRNPPFSGQWAFPGGFVNIDEPLETAARRELREETGIEDVHLEQLYTFGDPGRDPRMRVISVVYLALMRPGVDTARAGDDAAEARWFPADALPTLAFDHADIFDYALTRLRYKLEYTDVGFRLLPAQFTLSDLQMVYEVVLAEKLDKRNFRRKVLQANVLRETNCFRSGEGRPARLYTYRPDAEPEVKARRLFP